MRSIVGRGSPPLLLGVCAMIVGYVVVGCSLINSGPRLMQTIAEGAVATGNTLVAKMNPRDMTAGSSGEVHNPEFELSGFVASGVVYNLNARLIGAELDYNIVAGGTGGAIDPTVVKQIEDIWINDDVPDSKRLDAVLAIIHGANDKTVR